MKIFKNTIFYALIKCWKEIAISDKALIIIISILLVQCVYNLFTPEPVSSNEITICVIVRTTVASIFGYFLSENFLNHNRSQQKNSKTEITVTSDDNININDYLKISNNNNNNNNNVTSKFKTKNKSATFQTESKYYICNRTLQVIIALSVCIITLGSLLIAHDFHLISEDTNPTIIQFRDLIASCIGFLLGSSKNTTKI